MASSLLILLQGGGVDDIDDAFLGCAADVVDDNDNVDDDIS